MSGVDNSDSRGFGRLGAPPPGCSLSEDSGCLREVNGALKISQVMSLLIKTLLSYVFSCILLIVMSFLVYNFPVKMFFRYYKRASCFNNETGQLTWNSIKDLLVLLFEIIRIDGPTKKF